VVAVAVLITPAVVEQADCYIMELRQQKLPMAIQHY
jgi:hypothetical protein